MALQKNQWQLLGGAALSAVLAGALFGVQAQGSGPARLPLRGDFISRATFPNQHAHIPAQCYAETSFGTQNACQYCHTNGVAQLDLGNNNPQAGDNPNIGNLQAEYAFGAYDYPRVQNPSVNPWDNVLHPEVLQQLLSAEGQRPAGWDMQAYIRQDNWRAAYAQRPGPAQDWDGGSDSPYRLFPSLSPDDLPAQADGYVRSAAQTRGVFRDDQFHNGHSWVTGWRAINFMPYGIFTPQTGSVSGVYIRLPQPFMKDAAGRFDLATYSRNLDLVQRNVQDRLSGETAYVGAASGIQIVRGQYPLGTEFAHPLHYVDLQADGSDKTISPFPGTRAHRVKEIRWMYKSREWHPDEFGLAIKEESAPVYASRSQGWIDNGVGWLLGGWIEDKTGNLRAQTPSELTQCAACHSGNVRQSDIGQNSTFTSGTGNTIDSTWAMPRQLSGAAGWHEMDYLGYKAPKNGAAFGTLSTPEPVNRGKNVGEYRYFLDHVVGVSLFGNMPASVDHFLNAQITEKGGYSADWPALDTEVKGKNPAGVKAAQQLRQKLMREFTARGAYLNPDGAVRSELFVPTQPDALETARRYRSVVATQRYDFGKDIFPETPFTYRYFRTPDTAFTHQNGQAYQPGEVITDRPVDETPRNLTYGLGLTPTLIDPEKPATQGGNFVPDYVPLLK
ncbi:hypothetical protein [Deinococcus sp.]|uniref:hypothetical protein n=1 Tax=Deinococcus sp. TaxID=47478 RepID=UPI0025C61F64|nr:hypothetical protein [Deinococcus sp.]